MIAADVPVWLQKNGVKLLGVDLPSMDELDSKSLQNHHALARAGIAIIESLDLSDVAPGIYNFAALPLKIAGADGAPVRAVLWRAKGKHVLIEKPITDNTAHATELAELAALNGLILQVGHVERFNPVLGALEKHLTHPRFIESHRLSPYTERSADIGVVLDLMIHDLEVILNFVRSPLWSIDAVGVPVLSQSEDIANARLHFEDGCVANVTASRISPERMRKIRIFQEDAYISLDYQNQSGEIYRRVGKQIWRDRAEIEHGEPLKLQLTSFIECASTGRQPRVSGSQATAALELAVKITKQISSSG